ncbi:MAG TPA: hypothetical protein DCZ91_11855 [Lachnospiraceae bacterium]|nr:hypothetical protein [Lachnospiraceae bacterium]
MQYTSCFQVHGKRKEPDGRGFRLFFQEQRKFCRPSGQFLSGFRGKRGCVAGCFLKIPAADGFADSGKE